MGTSSAFGIVVTWEKIMELKLNELKITVHLNDGSEVFELFQDSTVYVEIRLLVDGKGLELGFLNEVSSRGLARSCFGEGEHFIFTCSCGDPGCGGIERGVIVLDYLMYYGECIRWLVPVPIETCRKPDWASHLPEGVLTYVEFIFDKQRYMEEVYKALCEIRRLVKETVPEPKLPPLMLGMDELESNISEMKYRFNI